MPGIPGLLEVSSVLVHRGRRRPTPAGTASVGRTTGASASSVISSQLSTGGRLNAWRVLLAGHVISRVSINVALPRPMCWT